MIGHNTALGKEYLFWLDTKRHPSLQLEEIHNPKWSLYVRAPSLYLGKDIGPINGGKLQITYTIDPKNSFTLQQLIISRPDRLSQDTDTNEGSLDGRKRKTMYIIQLETDV